MKLIIEKLHAAAFHAVKHPEKTAAEVGEYIGVSKRTIERWSKTAEWQDALYNLGFTGEWNWRRNPHRDVARDDGDLVDLAKNIYLSHREKGYRKTQSVQIAARTVGKTEQTIRNWRKRFEWETTNTDV